MKKNNVSLKYAPFLLIAFFTISSCAMAVSPPCFMLSWGSSGTGNGQLAAPTGIALDSSGDVYVSDSGYDRIKEFDSSGNYITQWGGGGSGNGQFNIPEGIAIDSSGSVYVVDYVNYRIQKFSGTGAYVAQWGSAGSGNGQFAFGVFGIAIDSSGNVYVADTYNNRIEKFSSTGAYITQWGSFGTGNGYLYGPYGIAIDSSGDVYVADSGNNRIEEFDSSGNYITQWGSSLMSPGSGNGQFNFPTGIALDSSGNVYVADTYNNRIEEFSSAGVYEAQWGGGGSGDGQFNMPVGIVIDSSGNVYVTDEINNRIQKFGVCPGPTSTPTITLTITPTCTITLTQTPAITPTFTLTMTNTLTPTATPPFCFELKGAFPNPASTYTYFIYNVCRDSEVNAIIYTVSGEVVRNLRQNAAAGWNHLYWDTNNNNGKGSANGVFIYSIEAVLDNDRRKIWGKVAVVK